MAAKKVLIITITYNDIDGLKSTIDSCQDFKNDIRHVIIDGFSNDGTIDFLSEPALRSHLEVYSEKDRGIYHAMNRGLIKLRKEKFVLFLNSGDVLIKSNFSSWLNSEIDSDSLQLFRFVSGSRTNRVRLNHQNIIFPADYCRENMYDSWYKISGDYDFIFGALTNLNTENHDFSIAEFNLDGVSNQFTSFNKVIRHTKESVIVRWKYNEKYVLLIYVKRFFTYFAKYAWYKFRLLFAFST